MKWVTINESMKRMTKEIICGLDTKCKRNGKCRMENENSLGKELLDMEDIMKQIVACDAADKQISVDVVVCFTMEMDLDGNGQFTIFLGKFSRELNNVGLLCSCGVRGRWFGGATSGWLGGGRGRCHDDMAVEV